MDTLPKPIAIVTEAALPRRTSELESRQVAEAAREELWEQASFMRDPFEGRFRLDLIHPPPEPDPEETERASIFLQKLREFTRDCIDGDAIDREEWVPEEVLDGLRELGAFGIKILREWGPGPLTGDVQSGPRDRCRRLRVHGSLSFRTPVDWCSPASDPFRYGRAEEALSPASGEGSALGLCTHRIRGRIGSREYVDPR